MSIYEFEYEIEHEYEVGDRVMWRGAFGAAVARPATITGLGEKNGRPLYDLDNGHWAYETQIDGLVAEPVKEDKR